MNKIILQKTKYSGNDMYELARRLYPITRSITGNGVRETLKIISEFVPLEIKEVQTGTRVLDWKVPKEWNIKEAWIKDSNGNRIIDFKDCNLHVLNYSVPVHKTVNLEELKSHVFTIPDHPDWIPYRTSYYNENWGFCMQHRQWMSLKDELYEVKIDSTLEDGHLSYGEFLIPGKINEEILLTAHICHPSLANDNLSGIVLATQLAIFLQKAALRYSVRILYIPGTIGSICWLSQNREKVPLIKHGLVLSLLGDKGKFHYKKSRIGDAEIDSVVQYVLDSSKVEHEILDFYPYGYDERQFCSPGFNLPVGRLSRSNHGEFPQYHTSADNMDFIEAPKLQESLDLLNKILFVLDNNRTYKNLEPFGEPQLGRRGLFKEIGGERKTQDVHMAYLWILNMSDGSKSLYEIAKASMLDFELIEECADRLLQVDLLSECI